MLNSNKKIAIIGLGLLGGSYAKGLHDAGLQVTGIDIDPSAVAYAKQMGWIEEGGDDPSLIADCDIVISALYPRTFVEWVHRNQKCFKSGALLSDVTGVKRKVIEEINSFLRKDIEYIACHPMAGREYKGIRYADTDRFIAANFIVVPTSENTEAAIQTAHDIGEALHFGHISELTPEAHDRMIGFVSQLTHVIAVSLMNVSDNTHLVDYTGDSFRDLTRIAKINESLWPELFILNKDNMIREIDDFTVEMQRFKQMISDEDIDGMRAKLIQSTERRGKFDRKD